MSFATLKILLYNSSTSEAISRSEADTTLQANINNLQSNIDTEESNRISQDTTLQTNINNLQNNIDIEETSRTNADTTLQNNIDIEETTRTNADTTLQTNITSEALSRTNTDTTLQTNINNVQNNIDIEETTRTNADTTLQTNITSEALSRTNADTTLQTNITSEALSRTNADTTLQTNITSEILERTNADTTLQTNITSEILERTNADTTLQTNITDEILERTNADTTLQTNITSEILERTNADTTLQTNITDEILERTNADTTLQTNIDNVIWHEYATEKDSNEIIYSFFDTDLISDVENTQVVVNELGVYRCTFNANYKITTGSCACVSELQALKVNLINGTFTSHQSAYGSEILGPGKYQTPGASSHAGILTLDAGGDPDSEFIFFSNAAHTTAASASIALIGGAKSCNVFWVAEGAIGFGTGCDLIGTYISNAAITAGSNLDFDGRLLTPSGAISVPGTFRSTVPLDSSPRVNISFEETLLFTGNGAISTTTYEPINTNPWKIVTDLGTITGFGYPYDGTYPLSSGIMVKIYITVNDWIYSTYTKELDDISNYLSLNMATTISVNNEERKNIKITAAVLSVVGGLIFEERSLYLRRLNTTREEILLPIVNDIGLVFSTPAESNTNGAIFGFDGKYYPVWNTNPYISDGSSSAFIIDNVSVTGVHLYQDISTSNPTAIISSFQIYNSSNTFPISLQFIASHNQTNWTSLYKTTNLKRLTMGEGNSRTPLIPIRNNYTYYRYVGIIITSNISGSKGIQELLIWKE
jgi:hypothetical protein